MLSEQWGPPQRLYRIEAKVREEKLSFKERYELRQIHAKPILKDMQEWLEKSLPQAPPTSALGRALTYSKKQWPYLYEYINYGEVEIDNNLIENEIRPFALGRRNWLFNGNEHGAEIGALYYSLIQTCVLNGIEARKYLHYVLEQAHKMRRKEIAPTQLLPQFIDKNLLR